MSTRVRSAMAAFALLGASLVGPPADAVPPVEMRLSSRELIRDYVRAVAANDAEGYLKLFDRDAMVLLEETQPSEERADRSRDLLFGFSNSYRRTQFISVSAVRAKEGPFWVDRFLLVEKIANCAPTFAECFPYVLTETVSVRDDKIVRLARSPRYFTSVAVSGFDRPVD
jgi:hypothetical protein